MAPRRKLHPRALDVEYGGEVHARALRVEVAALAERQWGHVGAWQLRDLGIPKATVDAWVRTGWLIPRFRGCYSVGHRQRTLRADFMAACLAVGRDAAISHICAAVLWGMLRLRIYEIDVVSPRQLRSRPGLKVRRRPGAPVTRRFNIPVTTPEETILGLAEVLRKDDFLLRAINQALVDRLLTFDSLNEHLARAGSRAGTRRIKDLLAVAGRARSFLEDDLVATLAGTGIESNFDFGGDEVDFYDPSSGTVLEIDSREYHGNPIAQLLDARKTERLGRRGLNVTRARTAAAPPPAPGTATSSRGGRSGGRP